MLVGVKTPFMTWPTKKFSPCNLAYIVYILLLWTANAQCTFTGMTFVINVLWRSNHDEFSYSCPRLVSQLSHSNLTQISHFRSKNFPSVRKLSPPNASPPSTSVAWDHYCVCCCIGFWWKHTGRWSVIWCDTDRSWCAVLCVALIFAIVGFGQMTQWALGKHKAYRAEFKDYPRGRKAIIPFIIWSLAAVL